MWDSTALGLRVGLPSGPLPLEGEVVRELPEELLLPLGEPRQQVLGNLVTQLQHEAGELVEGGPDICHRPRTISPDEEGEERISGLD